MSPRTRPLVYSLLALVVVLTAGCDALPTSGKAASTPTPIPAPPIPEKPTYTVRRGVVVDNLSFTARVAPVLEEELFFREDGRVKKVYLKRNDLVEEGTLLAELENDDLVRQLAQAELERETAEINLTVAEGNQQEAIARQKIDLEIEKLQLQKIEEQETSLALDVDIAAANLAKGTLGPESEDIEIAQRELERAKNSLWSSQVNRDSTCRLQGAACDSAQASVQSQEENVRIAEIELQKAMQGPQPADVRILRANYQKALQRQKELTLDLEIAKRELALEEMALAALSQQLDPQLAKAVERSKLAVDRLNAQVENTRIFSPIAGKLTSVSAYDGRPTTAYKTVFVVADETELEVTAEPMSSQLQRLTEGMPAAIVLSAYPGKELPGEIVQLPYPFGRGGGANIEEADKLTHISFDPQDLELAPGDLVKVIVTLEKREDALWLPPAAIQTFAGRKFVNIDEEGRRRRADITIGIESAERVEILEGVEEGQVVVGQ